MSEPRTIQGSMVMMHWWQSPTSSRHTRSFRALSLADPPGRFYVTMCGEKECSWLFAEIVDADS